MPTRYGDYTYAFADDLRRAQCVSKARKIYPFPADSSVFTQEEDYIQFIEYYEPLKPSAPHPDYANIFFIKDSPINDIGNGVGRWTRTWQVLPGVTEDGKQTAYVRSEYESYTMTVPGIDTAQNLFVQYPVNSYSISNGKHTIVAASSHDIVVGKGATIWYQVQDPVNKISHIRQVFKIALAGTTGATLVVDQILDINRVQIISIQRADIQQPSYQKVVTSRLDYTYHLPNVNVSSVDAIETIEPFYIVDNQTGVRVDYLSEVTSPSLDDYLASIAAREWMPVECVIRRWEGDIYERAVRYVRYQM